MCRRFDSVSRHSLFSGCSLMVEPQPSKLATRVRFSSSAYGPRFESWNSHIWYLLHRRYTCSHVEHRSQVLLRWKYLGVAPWEIDVVSSSLTSAVTKSPKGDFFYFINIINKSWHAFLCQGFYLQLYW